MVIISNRKSTSLLAMMLTTTAANATTTTPAAAAAASAASAAAAAAAAAASAVVAATTTTTTETTPFVPPQWMYDLIDFRQRLFLKTVEPIIVLLLGPAVNDDDHTNNETDTTTVDDDDDVSTDLDTQNHHRRLGFLPSYVSDVNTFRDTSMSFATLIMLFLTFTAVFLIFLSCFYHNQKTSPLFISPRRHRLPKLVPPPLPVDGYLGLKWVKVCFYLSDEEIINRVGFDSLVFIRFHRLALRCIVKMSAFSFVVLLPLNFTGGGHANAQDLKEYVGSLFFTDFLRFTMANIVSGSPRLWVHCFAAYLLTAIVVRELLIEYETFNGIRHRYLLSREPHLRTVLVTNIPRNLRSSRKITSYFQHVYPQAVKSVVLCQNLIRLEAFVQKRTTVLSRIENELLQLCRAEKKKLYEQSLLWRSVSAVWRCDACRGGLVDGTQERLSSLYSELEELNVLIQQEQRRRKRVMKMLDKLPASGEGCRDIDYVLASPFVSSPPSQSVSRRRNDGGNDDVAPTVTDPQQRQVLGLPPLNHDDNNGYDQPSTIQEGAEEEDGTVGGAGSSSLNAMMEQQQREHEEQFAGQDSSHDTALRSRTPPAVQLRRQQQQQNQHQDTDNTNSNNNIDNVQNDIKKSSSHRRQLAKAKHAIKRYGRFANQRNVTFLGRPIAKMNNNKSSKNGSNKNNNDGTSFSTSCLSPHEATTTPMPHSTTVELSSGGQIEDHLNEVTDKAFVVMRTYTAATIAIQSMHSSKPGSMQVITAPEPRDILWSNIYMSKGAQRTRSFFGEFVVDLIICFYVVPIATVSLLVSESALISSSPRLAQLDQASSFFSAAIALVQPMCIVGLQQLLPPLFVLIGQVEGKTSFSEVQMGAFSRYFFFQVLNVFLVTTIAGTIFDTVAIIIENPESAFEMLGNSLPRMSSFFITFVTIKTFLGLGFELVRIVALFQAAVRYMLFPNATLRAKRAVIGGMRPVDDPGWFPFHKILAQDMLVVVIAVVFAVVAPLVLLPCALFCLFSRIMWTHQHMYVYESVFESGGQFWPKIFRRFVFGLIVAQMTLTGQFMLKDARHEAYATIALMFMTYVFLRSTRARYDPTSSTLPLEVATVMDITLQQEEEAKRREYEQLHQQRGGGNVIPTENEDDDEEPGRYIGPFDPFRKAYLQPALRAKPNARPEQPFPPAQLGREDTFFNGSNNNNNISNMADPGENSEQLGYQDSGATARLRNMNQNDRRLINRWWSDQLQRAGPQNTFMVLSGEECGTLTLSGASMVDTDDSSVPASSHTIV
jgi:Calcium-dependent channel, 7TM region, putative phosphate/Late exocytosis, associated with Golgi transport/Cytosolic domain of 10TM putative phosphate transporter